MSFADLLAKGALSIDPFLPSPWGVSSERIGIIGGKPNIWAIDLSSFQ